MSAIFCWIKIHSFQQLFINIHFCFLSNCFFNSYVILLNYIILSLICQIHYKTCIVVIARNRGNTATVSACCYKSAYFSENVVLYNVTFFSFFEKENKKACKIKKCVIIYSCAEQWMPYTCFYMSFQKTPFFTEGRLFSLVKHVEKIFGK